MEIVLIVLDEIDGCRPEKEMLRSDVVLGELMKGEMRVIIDELVLEVRFRWTLCETVGEDLSGIVYVGDWGCTNMETIMVQGSLA